MSRLHALARSAAFALALVPTAIQAQSCTATDETFAVHDLGVYPDKIYHRDTVRVCFKNQTASSFYLVYTNKLGVLSASGQLSPGSTSTALPSLGHDVEIFPAINVQQGTNVTTVQCGTQPGLVPYTTCSYFFGIPYNCRTIYVRGTVPKYCQVETPYFNYTRLSNMSPARLYNGSPTLSY